MKDYEYQDLQGEDHEGNSKHTGDGHHADAGPTPDQSLKSLRTGRPCTHGPFSVTWEEIELISFDNYSNNKLLYILTCTPTNVAAVL